MESDAAFDPSHKQVTRAAAAHDDPFAFWAAAYAGVFDLAGETTPKASEAGCLHARATAHFLLTHAQSPGLRLVRSLQTIAEGGFDGFALRLTLEGRVSGRAGERFVACGPGDLLCLDLLEPLDLALAPEGEAAADITLWFPRARMLAAISGEQALNGLFLAGATPFGAMVGVVMRELRTQAARATARDLEVLIEGLLALLAKGAASLPALRPAAGSANASFVTIRRYIDRNLRSSSLSVDKLGKTFGISRAALYRLFEPVGGVAVYIRQARLRLAHREITAGDGKRIGIIAHQFGFKNVSAFNRAFRDAFGASPGEARQQNLDGAAIERRDQIDPGANPGRGDLALWLGALGREAAG